MDTHSSPQEQHDTVHPGTQKSILHTELSPELRSLEEFASGRYRALKSVVRNSDDGQFEYTSEAEHWLKGARATMLAALRVAQAVSNRQGE